MRNKRGSVGIPSKDATSWAKAGQRRHQCWKSAGAVHCGQAPANSSSSFWSSARPDVTAKQHGDTKLPLITATVWPDCQASLLKCCIFQGNMEWHFHSENYHDNIWHKFITIAPFGEELVPPAFTQTMLQFINFFNGKTRHVYIWKVKYFVKARVLKIQGASGCQFNPFVGQRRFCGSYNQTFLFLWQEPCWLFRYKLWWTSVKKMSSE